MTNEKPNRCSEQRYETDAILDWNEVALETALVDSKRPAFVPGDNGRLIPGRDQDGVTRASRALAIVHAAMYNVIVGISGRYSPYTGYPDQPPPAIQFPQGSRTLDVNAAVAAAARRTLKKLYRRQGNEGPQPLWRHSEQAYLDTTNRRKINAGLDASIRFGERMADYVLALRERDNSEREPVYEPRNQPGFWRPDLLDPTQKPLTPGWGRVLPFLLRTSEVDEIVSNVPPPPGWDSNTNRYNLGDNSYRENLSRVIELGDYRKHQPDSHFPRETLNAVFWSYDEGRGLPTRLYNQALRSIVVGHSMDLIERARLFLAANLTMADAAIVAWAVKYKYEGWRPIHGVWLDPDAPQGPRDPYNYTEEELMRVWRPFGKRPPYSPVNSCSPPFPAYVSGHSVIGSAHFGVIENFLGDCQYELTSDEIPRPMLAFTVRESAGRIDASREYLGVHFQADVVEGNRAGDQVARRSVNNLPGRSDDEKILKAEAPTENLPIDTGEDYRGDVNQEEFANAIELLYGDQSGKDDLGKESDS